MNLNIVHARCCYTTNYARNLQTRTISCEETLYEELFVIVFENRRDETGENKQAGFPAAHPFLKEVNERKIVKSVCECDIR